MNAAAAIGSVLLLVLPTACSGQQASERVITVALEWSVERTKKENSEAIRLPDGTGTRTSFQRIDGPLVFRYDVPGEKGHFSIRADGGVVIAAWDDMIDAVSVAADAAPPDVNIARAEATCRDLQKAGWQVESLVPAGTAIRDYAFAQVKRMLPSVGARICSASLGNAFIFVKLNGMAGRAEGQWRLALESGLDRHPSNEAARLRYEEESRKAAEAKKPQKPN